MLLWCFLLVISCTHELNDPHVLLALLLAKPCNHIACLLWFGCRGSVRFGLVRGQIFTEVDRTSPLYFIVEGRVEVSYPGSHAELLHTISPCSTSGGYGCSPKREQRVATAADLKTLSVVSPASDHECGGYWGEEALEAKAEVQYTDHTAGLFEGLEGNKTDRLPVACQKDHSSHGAGKTDPPCLTVARSGEDNEVGIDGVVRTSGDDGNNVVDSPAMRMSPHVRGSGVHALHVAQGVRATASSTCSAGSASSTASASSATRSIAIGCDPNVVSVTYGTNTVFGEMALLTGEPCLAAAIAQENTRCLKIGRR